MNIAIVIVTFGKSEHIAECLESLKKNNFSGIRQRFFVIDNTRRNLGFTGGNNQGIRQSLAWGADAVMLLNDDTKLGQEAVKNLSQTLFSQDDIGMTVPKIYFYPGFEYHTSRYQKEDRGKVIWYAGGSIDWSNVVGVHRGVDEVDTGQYNRQENVEFATGCCLMIKKEVFHRVGFLDKRYFLYLEDLDFNVRVKKSGFKIVYEPGAIVWHKNAQSSGVGSGLHDYFFTRNRLLFGMIYAPIRTKFALIRESGRLMMKGSKWQRQGAIDFYLRKFGKGSWSG